jgi:8-oxo-dGTP pyrophosphatase MutT (NUDIX family)
MTDALDSRLILSEHVAVGRAKPVSYLPIATIETVLRMDVQAYVRCVERTGAACLVFQEAETCIKSGAIYAFSESDLEAVLSRSGALLGAHDWPRTPSAFIARIARDWLALDHPLMPVIKAAFGDYPISIKGVVIHDGSVLLLLNERGEWDLPGGRPDPGEDHRAALVREVREEAGLVVKAGVLLDEHLFEVLPQRFVRIVAYACTLIGEADVVLSHEHLDTRWVPLANLGAEIDGRPLPAGYLGAIRKLGEPPLRA